MSQLVERQMDENKQIPSDLIDLEKYYIKAKVTIELLQTNIVKPLVENKQFFEKHKEINAENVVTLLQRGKQLYETHKEAIQILKLVTELDIAMKPRSLVWRIL